MTSFLLVVFDGLRPDMVRPETTPNLMRFAAMGTRFAHARSVFPSETRVCSASVATGCQPRRHGLVANQFAHPLDPRRVVDTGNVGVLRALQQDTGAALLDEPTLGDILAGAGQSCAVLSSGTTGQTYVLNPRADETGQLTLSAHGADACSAAGRELLATLDPPPTGSADRAIWIAEVFRRRIMPAPPAVTILWLCEPDSTGHYAGLGSRVQRAALLAADAAFGRILDDWQAGPLRDTLQIAVASDHGHATVTGRTDVRASLPDFADCTVIPGSSGGLFVPGGNSEQISALAAWLTRQDWCGPVYAADNADRPPGVLPRQRAAGRPPPVRACALHAPRQRRPVLRRPARHHPVRRRAGSRRRHPWRAAGRRDADRADARRQPHPARRAVGMAGRADRHRADRAGPAGPAGGRPMDGRVLGEAILDHPPRVDAPGAETWQAAGNGYAQTLFRTRLGRRVYIDQGTRT